MFARITLAFVPFLFLDCAAFAAWTVTSLHPVGTPDSFGAGMDATRQVGWTGGDRAALWTGSSASYVNLHPSAAIESRAWGQNGATQVGEARFATSTRAALWTGSAATYVDLNPVNAQGSIAYDVAGNQQVGVATIFGGGDRASLWNGTSASWTSIHPTSATSSGIYATDGTRQAGWARPSSGFALDQAAAWTGTAVSYVNLHPTGAASSRARGLDGNQQVGLATFGTQDRAALWSGTSASYVSLHPLGAMFSDAWDIDGGYQVGFANIGGLTTASLWTGTAASFFDLGSVLPSNYFTSEAREVYADASGVCVVGRAFNTVGSRWEAMLWCNPIPEPSLAGAGALVLLGAACHRRRR